jgi:hypothetical protein
MATDAELCIRVPATVPAVGQRLLVRDGVAEGWWQVVRVMHDPVEDVVEIEMHRVET